MKDMNKGFSILRFGRRIAIIFFALVFTTLSLFAINSAKTSFAPRAYAACALPYGVGGVLIYNSLAHTLQYCNDTDWVRMGPPIYDARAVAFDQGAGVEYLTGSIPSFFDTNMITGSFWVRRTVSGAQEIIMDTDGNEFRIEFNASNQIRIVGAAAGGGAGLEITSTAIADTNWHHVLFSFDMSNAANRYIYIDDEPAINTVTTYNNVNLDFTNPTKSIAADTTGAAATNFSGDLSDFWLDLGGFIDFSQETSRRKFISGSGLPMELGPNGNRPTGALPELFLRGYALFWNENRGSGEHMVKNPPGSLLDAATSPSDTTRMTKGCLNPSVPDGYVHYNADANVMQFCGGGMWTAMGPVPGTGGGGCMNPNGLPGGMAYNIDYTVMQYCDGQDWIAIQGYVAASGPCDDPNPFNFGDEPGFVNPNTLTNSTDIIQVTGMGCDAIIGITGDGGPEFRICNDAACAGGDDGAWSSTSLQVSNNDYVQMRATSPATLSTTGQVAITIGQDTDFWSMTTRACDNTPAAYTFTDLTNQLKSTLVTSNIVQITGIDTQALGCNATVSIAGTATDEQFRICGVNDCSTEVVTWGSANQVIDNGQYLQLRMTTSPNQTTTLTALPDISGTGDSSGSWSTTTLTCDDLPSTTMVGAFTDLTSQFLNTLVTSNIVQVNGITPIASGCGASVTLAGTASDEQYRICNDVSCAGGDDGAWTNAGGTIDNGEYLQLRMTTASVGLTTLNAQLDVGSDGLETWNTTTLNCDSTPNPTIVNAFTDDLEEMSLNTVISSNIVQIQGITPIVPNGCGATVSIAGHATAQFRICTDGSSNANCTGSEVYTWGTTSRVIENNHYVQVRVTSDTAKGVTRSGILTVGTESDTFDVRTHDDDPAAFNFTDEMEVTAAGAHNSADVIQITGITTGVPISISAGSDASAMYRVCTLAACADAPAFTSGAGTIDNNEYLQLQLAVPVTKGNQVSMNVDIGGIPTKSTTDWIVRRQDDDSNGFIFTDVTEVATGVLQTSNIVQITGITTLVPISISGTAADEQYRICDDAACAGGGDSAWGSTAGTVNNNDYVQVRATSSGSENTTVTAVLTVGIDSDTYSITTRDWSPTFSPADFTDVSDANLTTQYTSNIVQVNGLTTNVTISKDANIDEYRICTLAACADAPAWITAGSTINNGEYVQVRVTSGGSGVSKTGTLTIGTGSITYNVTTHACDSTPTFSPVDFTDAPNTATGATNVTSNILRVTGISATSYGCPAVTVGAFSVGEYQICDAADSGCTGTPAYPQNWTNVTGAVVELNEYVRVRNNASASYGTGTTTSITIGGAAAVTFTTTTCAAPSLAAAITDLTQQLLTTSVQSNIVQINGGASCSYPITALTSTGGTATDEQYRICNDAACAGGDDGAFTSAGGSITTGEYIQEQLTTSGSSNTTLTSILRIGNGNEINDTWSVATARAMRAFVSSTTGKGNAFGAGVAGLDATCASLASTAGFSPAGNWVAWASDGTSNVSARLNDSPLGWQTVTTAAGHPASGTQVAASLANLTGGTLSNALNVDENGTGVGTVSVWTGTSGGADTGTNCSNWTSGGGGANGTIGSTGSTTSTWSTNGINACNTGTNRIYCFEE